MLIKLIKHDLIATRGEFLGIYLGFLLLSLVAPILILNGPEWMQVLSVFAVFGVLIAIIIITLLAVIRLFQKRLYSNEGYLTWTLPVSVKLNLLSKVIVGAIWNIASFIVVWLGAFISSAIFLTQLGTYNQVIESANLLFIKSGFINKLFNLSLVFLPYSLVSVLYSVVFLLFVITLINTSWIKKGRNAIGIVIYFGLSLVIDAITTRFITQMPIEIDTANIMFNTTDPLQAAYTALSQFNYTINGGVVLAMIALQVSFIVLMSIGILYFVEKKMEIE
jgi:hypothetical protein